MADTECRAMNVSMSSSSDAMSAVYKCDIAHPSSVKLRDCHFYDGGRISLFMTFSMEIVRERLEQLMEERGIKRKPLALAAGLGETAIRDIFDDQRRDIRTGTLVKLADYFGVTLDDLIGRDAVKIQPLTAERLSPVLAACLRVVEDEHWPDDKIAAISEAVLVGLNYLPDHPVSADAQTVIGRIAADQFRRSLSPA